MRAIFECISPAEDSKTNNDAVNGPDAAAGAAVAGAAAAGAAAAGAGEAAETTHLDTRRIHCNNE